MLFLQVCIVIQCPKDGHLLALILGDDSHVTMSATNLTHNENFEIIFCLKWHATQQVFNTLVQDFVRLYA